MTVVTISTKVVATLLVILSLVGILIRSPTRMIPVNPSCAHLAQISFQFAPRAIQYGAYSLWEEYPP